MLVQRNKSIWLPELSKCCLCINVNSDPITPQKALRNRTGQIEWQHTDDNKFDITETARVHTFDRGIRVRLINTVCLAGINNVEVASI